MTDYVCPCCGLTTPLFADADGRSRLEDVAAAAGVPLLGCLPLDPTLGASLDDGLCFTCEHSDGAVATAIAGIVDAFLSSGDGARHVLV